MQQLPLYISATFLATVVLAYYLVARASGCKRSLMIALAVWIILQSIIACTGFYTLTSARPPRFPFLLLPPLLFLIYNMSTAAGLRFLRSLDIRKLTLFHTIRIPVELVLYGLFLHKLVPSVMTFEGRNLDILSGITAPIVYYLVFVKQWAGRRVLLAWNIICLGLLLNIVVHSILSAPTPFQQFGFEQPNTGILYFPFVLLPAFLVPMVILSHISAIKQLLNKKSI